MADATSVPLRVVRLPHAGDVALPQRASSGSAGLDLAAAVDVTRVLEPGERCLVPTGFVFELPAGYEGQVRPRSGLAVRHGITCLNSPGTIDSDYRGEVKVLLVNHGSEPFEIRRGDRIAQLVVAPVSPTVVTEVAELSETERGADGFGSTGVE